MKKKIIFTGGYGRFAQIFKSIPLNEKVYFPKKKRIKY